MKQTIGQRLKAEREEQRLTLEKVFETTRIRIQYLQALEADDMSAMPSPVQARGYLRNYAKYLGFDVEQMLAEMRDMDARDPSGEVIGPADEASAAPAVDRQPPQNPPALSTIEVVEAIEDKPVPLEEAVSSPSVTVPVKPKPARRKKPASESEGSSTLGAQGAQPPGQPASLEPTTRRRGRKRIDPEIALAAGTPVETVEPPSAPAESLPEPDLQSLAREPVAPAETPTVLPGVSRDGSEIPPEASEPPNVSDALWQTWLNRLGSVFSARTMRRTLVPKESAGLDDETPDVSPEPEAAAALEGENLPRENSIEILQEIGRDLRQRRELLSLHFDEVERSTHVKAHYLDALERGALDELSSTVQTRGMLSNYATFLDLDVDALLLRFADALQARHRERNPQKPARRAGQPIIAGIPPVRGFIAGDMIFGVGMAILVVGFAIWGVNRVLMIQSQREVKPTAPSISDVLLASPNPSSSTATPALLPVESFPGEATVTVEIPTQNANAQVQLNLVAVERTYLRVVVDGKVAFEGRVVPGNAYPFEAENQIEVLVGSGAAIRTVYNGRDLGLMGTFGQVVNNIYLGTEIITPTAMPTTTPTVTLTPTRTAVPTSTLRPTNTPVPSATAVP